MSDAHLPPDDERIARRSELTPEEQAVGSDDPASQAQAILEDSETRVLDRDGAPGAAPEHRHSEDVTDQP